MFWRNENTEYLDPAHKSNERWQQSLSDMQRAGQEEIPEILDFVFTRSLPQSISGAGLRIPEESRWLVQELYWSGAAFKSSLVLEGIGQKVGNTLVAGGVSVFLEHCGFIRGEICFYYHRLVCTNGMVRKSNAACRIEAYSVQEACQQIEQSLPGVVQGILVGFESLQRSAQVRLGLLGPIIPLVLDYMEIKEPYRTLILQAFEVEPGDTLWHFINAFTRAANMVMVETGIEPGEAAEKRYKLQQAGMRICDEFLETFTEGRSLIDSATGLKGILDGHG